ncbi:hypothetical protein BJY04DRAFT_190496 [Aspergillus karnatakaensis]|uniref:uncharacterized protein n=1 Tax=Aspergillus karnatakaensis TaxID=1810916 RepID=UPI003CCD86B8
MAPLVTAIQQHGAIVSEPSETYGEGQVILRIGNGGAGGTGLIAALAKDYLTLKNSPGAIQWVCNHSRNTQLALLHGHIDLALTYEREQEDISVEEKWATNAGCLFHDHFCLAGPAHDPANIRQAKSIAEAFDRIATTRSPFHSRSDGSATMWKERRIWHQTHRQPWTSPRDTEWYIRYPITPSEAVARADAAGAYILCDRSTLLTQTSRALVSRLRVYFEPTDRFNGLMNSCYALTTRSSPEVASHVASFLDYVKSERGQSVIAQFGTDNAGLPLFAPSSDGYAHRLLTGGKPQGNCWI